MTLRTDEYRVTRDRALNVSDMSAKPSTVQDTAEIESRVESDLKRIVELQKKLRAGEQGGLLVILMAVDTGGKDETIAEVFGSLDLRGTSVAKFGAPSETDQKHDFLWRIHQAAPGKGEIVIFNRSHYDEITEPWVRGEIDEATRRMRYEHVRNFEKLLTDSGIHLLKLHFRVSREEQARRVMQRLEDPESRHEFDPHDIDVQREWDTYQAAFEEILNETSTENAPWHVIPADEHPYRRLIAARLVVEALEAIGPRYPEPDVDLEKYRNELEKASGGAASGTDDG